MSRDRNINTNSAYAELEYRNFTVHKTKETEVYRENGVDKYYNQL
jgi:hypothetical protein